MPPATHPFVGEFWNVDRKTHNHSRYLFTARNGRLYVETWGHCFPTDCEWGRTPLTLLSTFREGMPLAAFAIWRFDSKPIHVLFKMDGEELTAEVVTLHGESTSYDREVFRKDAARSAQSPMERTLERFAPLWDGSESGWKLVRFRKPAYFIAFRFNRTGPTRREIAAIGDFILHRGETADQCWKRLRRCCWIAQLTPLNRKKFDAIRKRVRKHNLRWRVTALAPGEHVIDSPQNCYYARLLFSKYLQPVVQRMLAARARVVTRILK